jgi:putative oxidoreductase
MFDIAWRSGRPVTQGVNDMDQTFSKWQPIALSLFRFITGLLLFQYGVAKIFKFPAMEYFAHPPPLIMVAGTLELVLGALLMVGLFTRPVAFLLSGEMAFAYFLGHMFKNPSAPVLLPLLNGGTAAILFCFACLYLSTAGGGPISIDAMRKK